MNNHSVISFAKVPEKSTASFTPRQLGIKDSASSLLLTIPLVILFVMVMLVGWGSGLSGDNVSRFSLLYLFGYIGMAVFSLVSWFLLAKYSGDIPENEDLLGRVLNIYAWALPCWAAFISYLDAIELSRTFNVQIYVIANLLVLSCCSIKPSRWVEIQLASGAAMLVASYIYPLADSFSFISELICYLITSVVGGAAILRYRRRSYSRQAALQEVLESVEYDELTGVYTRQAFFHHAKELIEQYPEKYFDVTISDIQNFRMINQQYGERAADSILRKAGEEFNRISSRNENIIFGRYGADQFVCILEHRPGSTVDMLNIDMGSLAGAEVIPGMVIKVGIYENIDRSLPMAEICDRAVLALRSIKHRYGVLFGFYTDEMQSHAERRLKIEQEMDRAYTEEQFLVYYQPKHDAVTGRLIGAEALLRWQHPELGFLPPFEFIPVFEENGFINKADYYVWKHTIENQRKWLDMGLHPVPVSVNSSRNDFNDDDYISIVSAPLKNYDIDPSLMHIEVTESLFTDNLEKCSGILDGCRKLGIKIELDDFGSGYSSLNTLGILPVDYVKFDMSFARQLNNERRAKVLSSCILLAKSLGLITISEGVETEAQRQTLVKMGCECIQGYYYSKPLPEDEFEEYLRRENAKLQD